MTIVSDVVTVGGTPTDGITVALYKESDMSLLGTGVTGAVGGNAWPTGVANITYSNANRTAVTTGPWVTMPIVAVPTTGKYYIELDYTGSPMFGMKQGSTIDDGSFLAQSGNAASVGDSNRVSGFFSYASGSLSGDTDVAIAADMDAGQMYVYRNGSLQVTFNFTANSANMYFAGSPYSGRSITLHDTPNYSLSGFTYLTNLPDQGPGEYSIDTTHTGLAFLVFKSPTTATPPDFTGAENHKISRIYLP